MSIIEEAEYYHRFVFDEKKNFLLFIDRLSKGGFKEKFKLSDDDFSLWWSSLVAEKNIFKSDSYEKLISFLMSTENNEYDRKILRKNIKDTLLYQLFRGFCSLCYFIIRSIYIKLSMKNLVSRMKKLREHHYLIVSYFPLLNKSSLAMGKFENGYIGAFHKILEEKKKEDYSHVFIQVYIDGYNLKDAVSLARKFSDSQSVFFLEEFFKISHLFKFTYYYFRFLFLFIKNLQWMKRSVNYTYKGKVYNVWHIFKFDFYKSFCGYNLISSIWNSLLFKELISLLNEKCKILCICEMQEWEKPLYYYAEKKGLMTIGIQHTIVPELLLQYFNSLEEFEAKHNLIRPPLPDYLATVGEIPARMFKRYGWPEKRVFVWGAHRFEAIKYLKEWAPSWREREDCIVMLFSISAESARALLSLLDSAFKGKISYKIVLKSHPSLNLKEIINKMKLYLDPSIFEFSDDSITALVKRAKGVIVRESSSSLFALACYIPIIVPRFANKIDCNPLSYITDIPIYTYSAEQLRSVCDEIISNFESPVDHNRFRTTLDDYFYFAKDNDEYFEKIFNLGG